MKRMLFHLLLLCCTASAFAQPTKFDKKFPLIDRFVDSLMKTWNIPGMAIGIVYKDKLIYSKGYGYRDLEKKLPVTTNTIFPIASNTKLFTATAAAILEEEKLLSLDVPVRTYLPELKFYNDELNAKVTLRDMLAHRTGLPTYDGIWVNAAFTRKEALEKVAFMKPAIAFRQGYIYNNTMYSASGAVLEAVSHKTWEQLIKDKFFLPLKMSSSCFTNQEMYASPDFAWSYYESDSSRTLKQIVYTSQSVALGGAGVIKSTVNDMSHWMIALLNDGNYEGSQKIPKAAIQNTLIPNSISDRAGRWPELSNSLYGLGRAVQTYKGYKIATHTGSIDGYNSNLVFVPSEQIAIFMIENSTRGGYMRGTMGLAVIDRLLGLSQTPWSERIQKIYGDDERTNRHNRDSIAGLKVPDTKPSHELSDYTGKYYNPTYGIMSISLESGKLFINSRGQHSPLHHFHYDLFETGKEASGYLDYRVQFFTGSDGKIVSLSTVLDVDEEAKYEKMKDLNISTISGVKP